MKIDTQTAADTAIARLAMLGEREDLKALPDSTRLGRWLGKDTITLGDARAVAAWAREKSKPVLPVAPVADDWMAANGATIRQADRALRHSAIEFILIVGPSGCGKTRLVRHLMRLAEEAGSVCCNLPTLNEALDYSDAMEREGGPTKVWFGGNLARSLKPARVVVLENLESHHGEPIENLRGARARTLAYRGGKVVATLADEDLLRKLRTHFAGRLSVIRLGACADLARAA